MCKGDLYHIEKRPMSNDNVNETYVMCQKRPVSYVKEPYVMYKKDLYHM